jgi:uncharacterized membrane protein affecting hemolysin expression
MMHVISIFNEPSLTKKNNVKDASIYERNKQLVFAVGQAFDIEIRHTKALTHRETVEVLGHDLTPLSQSA